MSRLPRHHLLWAVPIVVVALLVVAVVGYGAWTRRGETTYARGGAFAALQPDPSASADAPSSTATPGAAAATGGPSPAASAAAVPPGSASEAPVSAPVTSRAPEPGRTAAPATRAAFVVPRTGTYGVRVSGREKVDFGPVSFCDRALPAASEWVVTRPQGEGAGAFTVDHRFYPGQADQHDERHIYRATPGGVLLSFEQATVTCSGVRQATDVDYDPEVLRVQLPLRVGATWTSRGGDAERTESGSSRVLRTEDLRVGSRSYRTWVVETAIEFSGDESGSRTTRWWFAPELGLPLQVYERTEAGRSGASYVAEQTTTVTSLPG